MDFLLAMLMAVVFFVVLIGMVAAGSRSDEVQSNDGGPILMNSPDFGNECHHSSHHSSDAGAGGSDHCM